MPLSDQDASNKPENDRQDSAFGALESAERHIAGSTDTGSCCDGSGEAFSITFSALVDWAHKNQVVFEPSHFSCFDRPTDGHGEEHEAWYEPPLKRWLKSTYLNEFGLAWGRKGTATPHEYLIRLQLQNLYFGDDIRLVALINCKGKIRLLTSQPHVAGAPATYDEIQEWFKDLGFRRLDIGGRIAWYYVSANLLIADAHEGNVIRTAAGTLVPIDLNLIQPQRTLYEAVRFEIAGQVQLTLRL